MVKMRNYVHLRGVHLTHTTWDWDSTYHNMLYNANTTLHSALSSTDSVAVGSVEEEVITTQRLGALSFLYPLVPEELYVLDGVADGNVVVKSDAPGGWAADLDMLVLTLQKLTAEGVEDTLGSYTLGGQTSSGGSGLVIDGGSEGGEGETGWQFAFPFWFELSAQELSDAERLRLEVELWARSGTNVTTNTLYLVAARNTDDLYIRLPVV
ncbi:MAG: hypothetical protein ACXQT1_02055 [Methermicoccaceae archaeon]